MVMVRKAVVRKLRHVRRKVIGYWEESLPVQAYITNRLSETDIIIINDGTRYCKYP